MGSRPGTHGYSIRDDNGRVCNYGMCCRMYLQQTRQLAVPVVDVLVAVPLAEGIDAVAQCQEGAVDMGSFFQPLSSVLRLREAIRE